MVQNLFVDTKFLCKIGIKKMAQTLVFTTHSLSLSHSLKSAGGGT
jgi:hypothetical protein